MSNPDQQSNFIRIGSICSICRDELLASSNSNEDTIIPLPLKASNGDTINRLPCNHDFHGVCIILWLFTSNNCPLCRCNLPKEFPMKSVLGRLILHLKMRKYKRLAHTFWLFICVFYLLDQDPANSGPHTKPFLIQAMQELHSFTAELLLTMPSPSPSPIPTPSYDVGMGTHQITTSCCAICSGELYYVSSNVGGNICPLCRCNLSKDIPIKCVLEHLISTSELQNLDLSWLIYQLFECILYLLVQDEENSRHVKPFLAQAMEQFNRLIDGLIGDTCDQPFLIEEGKNSTSVGQETQRDQNEISNPSPTEFPSLITHVNVQSANGVVTIEVSCECGRKYQLIHQSGVYYYKLMTGEPISATCPVYVTVQEMGENSSLNLTCPCGNNHKILQHSESLYYALKN